MLWQWLKAVGIHWLALMSCAIFTLIGFIAAITNETNRWIVWAMVVGAVVCLFTACFLAWKDEHEKFLKEEARNQKPHIEGEILDAYIGSAITGSKHLLDKSAVVSLFQSKDEPEGSEG